MPFTRILLPLAGALLLAACGGTDDEAGITSTEERQLDDAAAALDDAQAEYEAAIQTPAPESSEEPNAEH